MGETAKSIASIACTPRSMSGTPPDVARSKRHAKGHSGEAAWSASQLDSKWWVPPPACRDDASEFGECRDAPVREADRVHRVLLGRETREQLGLGVVEAERLLCEDALPAADDRIEHLAVCDVRERDAHDVDRRAVEHTGEVARGLGEAVATSDVLGRRGRRIHHDRRLDHEVGELAALVALR